MEYVNAMLLLVIILLMCPTTSAYPSSYDMRDEGFVTPTGDQGKWCGCCNTFTVVGMLESAILKNQGPVYDLSENHAKECVFLAVSGEFGSCHGGNANMVISLLSSEGIQLEKDNPYEPWDSECNYIADPAIRVTGWDILATNEIPHPDIIKKAILDHGAVFASLDGTILPKTYDGKSVIYQSSNIYIGHSVLIVGWDDNKIYPGGMGAWIVKNSWGADWGDKGFGWIAYGAGRIGVFSSVITDYELYNHNTRTLFYDEAGWTKSIGFQKYPGTKYNELMTHGHMANEFPLKYYEKIEKIEFWTTGPAEVDLYLFEYLLEKNYEDVYSIPVYGRLLYTNVITVDHAGYHSVIINPGIISGGSKVAVVARFENLNPKVNKYSPLALDTIGPVNEKSYVCNEHISRLPGTIHAPGRPWVYWISEWVRPGSEGDFEGYPEKKVIGDATLRLRVSAPHDQITSIHITNKGEETLTPGNSTKFSVYSNGYGPIEWKNTNQKLGTIYPNGTFKAENTPYEGFSTIYAVANNGVRSNYITIKIEHYTAPIPIPTPVPTPVPVPTSIPEPMTPEEQRIYDAFVDTLNLLDHADGIPELDTGKVINPDRIPIPPPISTPKSIYYDILPNPTPIPTPKPMLEAIIAPDMESVPVPELTPAIMIKPELNISEKIRILANELGASRTVDAKLEYIPYDLSELKAELEKYDFGLYQSDTITQRSNAAYMLEQHLKQNMTGVPIGQMRGFVKYSDKDVFEYWIVFYNYNTNEFIYINPLTGVERSMDMYEVDRIKI